MHYHIMVNHDNKNKEVFLEGEFNESMLLRYLKREFGKDFIASVYVSEESYSETILESWSFCSHGGVVETNKSRI